MTEYVSGQALRVLLVSARGDAPAEAEEALALWSGDSQLFWVSQSEMALPRAQEVVPHVILVDDDLAGSDPITLIKRLSSAVPGAALLALVDKAAIDRASQAVLAGARGFATKPLLPTELAATMRQVSADRRAKPAEEEREERDHGRIVVFASPKGGSGRTLLAVNTAAALHSLTKRPVAIMDADFAAPALDVALNLHGDRDVTDLLGRISRLDDELIAGVMEPHATGIEVLLAPPPWELEEPLSLPQVQQILVSLQRVYDWVIVDLGLPINQSSFGFLDSADKIVVCILPEMIGLRNSRLMVQDLGMRSYKNEKLWLVLNRATMRAGIQERDIEGRLGLPIKLSIPDDQALATHSVNRGVPLFESHQRSAVARAINTLAKSLVTELAPDQLPQKSGLFSRLFGSG